MFPPATPRPPRPFLIVAATLVLGVFPARAAVTTFTQFTNTAAGTSNAPVAASVPTDLTLLGNGFAKRSAAPATGAFSAAPAPLAVPEADALPALGLLVGVAGLWELSRRFRGGWTRAGRVEIKAS